MDIFPLLQDPIAFETLITHLMHHILTTHKTKPDVIVGLDARGFLLGPIIAMRLGASFVPVRKGGKLPGDCEKVEYKLEYGSDVFEMQKGAIKEGQSVIVIEWVYSLYPQNTRLIPVTWSLLVDPLLRPENSLPSLEERP
jgi:adenine phosphoribosyltransferase